MFRQYTGREVCIHILSVTTLLILRRCRRNKAIFNRLSPASIKRVERNEKRKKMQEKERTKPFINAFLNMNDKNMTRIDKSNIYKRKFQHNIQLLKILHNNIFFAVAFNYKNAFNYNYCNYKKVVKCEYKINEYQMQLQILH